MLTNVCGIMRDLEQEARDYNHRCEQIRLAAEHHKRQEIARVCMRYELESDEFELADDKARRIIREGLPHA